MKKKMALLLLLGLMAIPMAGYTHDDDDATQVDTFTTVCTDSEDPESCTTVGGEDTYYVTVDTIGGGAQVWKETNGQPGLQTHAHDDVPADTQVEAE